MMNLDSGVTLEWTYHEPEGIVGFILRHPSDKTASGRCGGHGSVNLNYDPNAPTWTFTSEVGAPLSMTPSFRCHCGFHGFITNGRWVPV